MAPIKKVVYTIGDALRLASNLINIEQKGLRYKLTSQIYVKEQNIFGEKIF